MTEPGPPVAPAPGAGGGTVEDWLARAREVSWIRRPRDLGTAPRWFAGASLNTCYNALDRHVVHGHGDTPALVVEPSGAGAGSTYSFAELLESTAAFAGALRGFGVSPGDRVLVQLPTSAEAVLAMLACARVGGVHAVVPLDADAQMLAGLLDELSPTVVVTTVSATLGGRVLEPRSTLDRALALTRHRPEAVVVRQPRTPGPAGAPVLEEGRDVDWDATLRAGATDPAGTLEVEATDPLYVLAGAGGPATVRHNGAHAVAAAWVASLVLEGRRELVWWATSGLTTGLGPVLAVHAPLLGGLTTVLLEESTAGDPPGADVFWRTVGRHRVDVVLSTAAEVASWRDAPAGGDGARPLQALVVLDGPLDPDTQRWAEERLAERVLAPSGSGSVAEDPFLAAQGLSSLEFLAGPTDGQGG